MFSVYLPAELPRTVSISFTKLKRLNLFFRKLYHMRVQTEFVAHAVAVAAERQTSAPGHHSAVHSAVAAAKKRHYSPQNSAPSPPVRRCCSPSKPIPRGSPAKAGAGPESASADPDFPAHDSASHDPGRIWRQNVAAARLWRQCPVRHGNRDFRGKDYCGPDWFLDWYAVEMARCCCYCCGMTKVFAGRDRSLRMWGEKDTWKKRRSVAKSWTRKLPLFFCCS